MRQFSKSNPPSNTGTPSNCGISKTHPKSPPPKPPPKPKSDETIPNENRTLVKISLKKKVKSFLLKNVQIPSLERNNIIHCSTG